MADLTVDLITKGGFMQYEDNYYAVTWRNLYFSISTKENSPQFTLTFSAAFAKNRFSESFTKTVTDAGICTAQDILIGTHDLGLRLSAESADWADNLPKICDFLADWAVQNKVSNGCYLCGKDDGSVIFRKVENTCRYVCDSCFDSPPEQENAEQSFIESAAVPHENLLFGAATALIVRVILSIPVVFLLQYLGKEDAITLITVLFLVYAGVSGLLLFLHVRCARGDSLIGMIVTGCLHTAVSFFETCIALSLIASNAQSTAVLQKIVSPLEVLAHYSSYTHFAETVPYATLVAFLSFTAVFFVRWIIENDQVCHE